jgi:hypothetical protein
MLEFLASLFEFIFGVCEAVTWVVDIVAIIAEVSSWFKGRENRIERREARCNGEPVPPRDRWNRRVIWLALLIVLLTGGLVAWRVGHSPAKKSAALHSSIAATFSLPPAFGSR